MSKHETTKDNEVPQSALIAKIREERNLSKKSLAEIEKKWTNILSQEKIDSLKVDFDEIVKRYNVDIKRKNEIVKHLVKRSEESEVMRRTAIASHLLVIDGMASVHHNQLCEVETKFHDRVKKLRIRYNTEKGDIVQKYEMDKMTLLNEIEDYEQSEKRFEDKENREQQEELEEIRNKNLEDINSLRFILDTRIEDLDEQFELAKNEYLQKTDIQSESLQQKLFKDEEMTKEMVLLQKKIDKLCLAVRKVKRIAHRKSMQNLDRNQQLMRRKTEIISRYKNTKAKMDDLRQNQHEKLKDLTMRSSKDKAYMEGEFRLSEKVLKLSKLTSKLETQDGLGFEYLNIVWSKTKLDANVILQRYNQVMLHFERALQNEEMVLEENRLLKKRLRNFRDGITVNERVMCSNNPLVVINGKMRPETCHSNSAFSDDAMKSPKSHRRLTVVDANHAVAISHAR